MCDIIIVELRVPADRVGLIIGRGGETIKRLQDETGAHIQVIISIQSFAQLSLVNVKNIIGW
jgi:transcription antitermination factor NusA-like protein